jgi:protease-4
MFSRIKANKNLFSLLFLISITTIFTGCVSVNVPLHSANRPLQEFRISGKGDNKVLLISINGTISNSSNSSIMGDSPSIVQEVVSQLDLARQDKKIKAIILKINSPGGTITASDILYNELTRFKKETKKKLVVCMMDVAASGGYYISLPADVIIAHPTTVTGSIGVVMMQPKFYGLMEKIGVEMNINKSGKNKDMGSPYRAGTAEEKKLFLNLTTTLAEQFYAKVRAHRKISDANFAEIKTARVFLAQKAKDLNLIDKIGYLSDAIKTAETLAKIKKNSQLIVYRRYKYSNDNVYNGLTVKAGKKVSLIDLGILNKVSSLPAGFYYIWTPGL